MFGLTSSFLIKNTRIGVCMKNSVKLLSIVFIVIFLMPIASYADGRVRFNYRVAGSSSNPELGAINVSSYTMLVTMDWVFLVAERYFWECINSTKAIKQILLVHPCGSHPDQRYALVVLPWLQEQPRVPVVPSI